MERYSSSNLSKVLMEANSFPVWTELATTIHFTVQRWFIFHCQNVAKLCNILVLTNILFIIILNGANAHGVLYYQTCMCHLTCCFGLTNLSLVETVKQPVCHWVQLSTFQAYIWLWQQTVLNRFVIWGVKFWEMIQKQNIKHTCSFTFGDGETKY